VERWNVTGLSEQQAARVHFSALLRRWNPDARTAWAVTGTDWAAPVLLTGSVAATLATPHPAVVLLSLTVGALSAFLIAGRAVRRRHVAQLTDRLVVTAHREGRRHAEAAVVRCAGDLNKLERRIAHP
jgi:hypothetical protein